MSDITYRSEPMFTFHKLKWWLIYNLLMIGGITSYVLIRTQVLGLGKW